MAFGVMGAHFQPMGHVYVMNNMFDYGMGPQEALDAPRMFFEGDAILVEDSVPADVRGRAAGARAQLQRRAAAVGRRADRDVRPGQRHADRRLRPPQGRHGARLLRRRA